MAQADAKKVGKGEETEPLAPPPLMSRSLLLPRAGGADVVIDHVVDQNQVRFFAEKTCDGIIEFDGVSHTVSFVSAVKGRSRSDLVHQI